MVKHKSVKMVSTPVIYITIHCIKTETFVTDINKKIKDKFRTEKMENKDLYERLKQGKPISMYDPAFAPAITDMRAARKISFKINNEYHELDELPPLFAELLGEPFQEGTAIMPPFHIDMGQTLKLGKHVFINHNCTCMTAGTIIIEDHVMIGPQVTLLTTNHDFDDHNVLICKSIHIKKNAWIGCKSSNITRCYYW